MVTLRYDLTGQVFTYLTIQENLGYGRWRCLCRCGKLTDQYSCHLRDGSVKSCGCRKSEMLKLRWKEYLNATKLQRTNQAG